MRIRHRIPSIFNLSMVDVLCCALGCVILLWLLNLKDAKQRAAQVSESDELLMAARRANQQLLDELDASRRNSLDLRGELDETAKRESNARRRLEAAEKSQLVVSGERDAARQAVDRLTQQRIDLERRLQASARRAEELSTRIIDLSATAKLVPDLENQLKSYRTKLAEEETKSRSMAKDIELSRKSAREGSNTVETLRGNTARLEKELAVAQRRVAAADNRFAGITLSGKRVVFLVDMSGSMELVDAETPAPSKWQGVRETVSKIMSSLPELEKFQVLLFAEKTSFLLGEDGRWIDFDPKTSAERATKALSNTKPEGGTNMYSALEMAFRLRGSGLDTIYLLSDGLPNVGEPLTDEQMQKLKETEKGEILGRHIRKKLKEVWNRPIDGHDRVRINSVGFFYESPDVGAFLWALSRENDGSFVGMSKP